MQRLHRNPLRLVPHVLTLLRLPLAIVFYLTFPALDPGSVAISGALLGLAAASDYLDGMLARRLGTVGTFGKWADPLADALFFLGVYLSFHRAGLMPLPLLLLFAIREGLQYTVIRPLSSRRHVDPGARPAGKLKTGLQLAGTALVIGLAGARAAGAITPLGLARASTAILIVLVAVSVGSLYWYVVPLVASRHSRAGKPAGNHAAGQDPRSSR